LLLEILNTIPSFKNHLFSLYSGFRPIIQLADKAKLFFQTIKSLVWVNSIRIVSIGFPESLIEMPNNFATTLPEPRINNLLFWITWVSATNKLSIVIPYLLGNTPTSLLGPVTVNRSHNFSSLNSKVQKGQPFCIWVFKNHTLLFNVTEIQLLNC